MEKPILKIITDVCEQENNLKDFAAQSREVTGAVVNLPADTINPLTVPSIKSHTDDEIFVVILMSLAKSFTDLGRPQPSTEDKNYLANSLADMIPRKYASIRLHEIPIAFANGIRGKYGEFYGLNLVSFENFIEGHLAQESREQFARLLPPPPAGKEPDEESKFQLAGYNAVKALTDYSAGKDISLSALVVYNFLNSLKLIKYTPEEKWDFIEEAAAFLETDLVKQAAESLDKIHRIKLRRQVEEVKARTAVELIRNTAKKLTLYAFFQSCIMEKQDLAAMIKEQRHLFQQ